MERVDRILRHSEFLKILAQIEAAEAERRFCRHTIQHSLDVARIGLIINLEEGLSISKEWIYAVALLHDIGRALQYQEGVDHEQAGVIVAKPILIDCGFAEEEIKVILSAMEHHGSREVAPEKNLNGILYRADKASRLCFWCEAREECNWPLEQKNMGIYI